MANLEANSRVERTKTIIARLDQLVMEKYESYKTRAIPLRIPAGVSAEDAAKIRLFAIRELMRMEMPIAVGLGGRPASDTLNRTGRAA